MKININTEAWGRAQLKAIFENRYKNNKAEIREAASRLIECVPPCDAKLQLILIATGEVEPSINALVEGLIEGWGALNHE